MGLIELASEAFRLTGIDDTLVVKEKTGLGWVEWGPNGGVFIDLDQMKKLRDGGKLRKYSVKRQDDGRYLVNLR